MTDFLEREFLDNTYSQYLLFLGTLLLAFILRKPIVHLCSRIIFRMFGHLVPNESRPILEQHIKRPLGLFIFLIALFIAFQFLEYPQVLDQDVYGLHIHGVVVGIYRLLQIGAVTWMLSRTIDFMGEVLYERAERTKTMEDNQVVLFIKDSLKVILWVIALLMVMGGVFRLDISSLLAGAGLAGLAIALAAQDSLRNLLGSLTIFSEKPFTVGDYIQVGSTEGTVEKVGFRSTRIRTPDKTYLTLPNKEVVDKPLNNLSLRNARRVKFTIGLTYDTKREKVQSIVADISDLLRAHPGVMNTPTVAFTGFGESALDVLIDYNLSELNWQVFLRERQALHLGVMEIVEKHGVAFAYPTRTIRTENHRTESR